MCQEIKDLPKCVTQELLNDQPQKLESVHFDR